ncbi:hypothetical protein ABIA33_002317 [Streptacidiphilus sp. MAP12-16]|uniref:hypothetical protein n=1 Tax=Streptacidiphilus sp. MAP12-16 TaxID=3156300 RepID=UPI003511CC07
MAFVEFMGGQQGRATRRGIGVAMIGAGAVLGGSGRALAAGGPVPLAVGLFDVCPAAPQTGLPFRARDVRVRACR